MNVKQLAESCISYRRSIGEKCKSNGDVLLCFARRIGENKDINNITLDDCTAFLYGEDFKVTASWFIRYASLKWMFEWAISRGYMTSIPLPLDKPKSPDHMKPYIYSKIELKRLFEASMHFQKNRSKIVPECIQMIIKLTYLLGLRIQETISIRLIDIDMESSLVVIHNTKFNKTRLVPFNQQVKSMLCKFVNWRNSQHPNCGKDSALFLDRECQPYKIDTIQDCFQRIREVARIKRDDGAYYQPRIHDLRHSFAVHRLTAWYREGKDVQRCLCHLSTYLGNDDISHTSVYLTMTDNIYKEANKLFNEYRNGTKE